MSKYLPLYGIEPIIYTPKLSEYPYEDRSLLEDVSSKVQVWKRPIWSPEALFRRLTRGKSLIEATPQGSVPQPGSSWIHKVGTWIRTNIFIPDQRITWVYPSIRFLSKRLCAQPVDLVISTGPPHSMHLIGMALQKRLSIPWWADFRDCWTRWEMLLNLSPNRLSMALHRRLERSVITRCDKLLTVSARWARDFEQNGAKSTLTLHNGYDDADTVLQAPLPAKNVSKTSENASFRLLHLGSLGLDRAAPFLKALRELVLEDPALLKSVNLTLGGLLDPTLRAFLEKDLLLQKPVHVSGYVPHSAVFSHYLHADVLLLFAYISPSVSGQLPGKLFEYLAARRPILAVGVPGSELDQILRRQRAGILVPYDNIEAIKSALKKLFGQKLDFSFNDPTYFSRQKQANTLAKAIHSIKSV